MSSRRAVLGLLSVAAIAVSVVLPSSSADAAPAGITVQGNSSPQDNIGLVTVFIASSSPLTTMTLSLFQNGQDKLDLPMSDFTVPANDGNGQFGGWTLINPITTGQLPLGQYQAQ